MKKIFRIAVLFSVSAGIASGCIEESMEPVIPAESGDEILFGVRAGFENSDPDTKTVYGGDIYQEYDEAYYEVGGVTFERIYWTAGDMVEVYSPDADNGPTAHYKVNIEDPTNVVLDRIEYGLQWKGDSEHKFYAMYPSSKMFGGSVSTQTGGIFMSNQGLIHGDIPNLQNPISVKHSGNNWVLQPDMRYAYMAAYASATRFSQNTGEDEAEGSDERIQNGIQMTFMPIVTALKMTMTLGSEATAVELTKIDIKGKGLAGAFTCDLQGWTGESCPVCSLPSEVESTISIDTWQVDDQDKDTRQPLKVQANGTLTFTVFVHPGADIESLTITLWNGSLTQARTITGTQESPILKKQKKTFINNFHLPEVEFELNEGNWMDQFDPETKFNRLSIPGAGSAFSRGGGDGYKAQTLSFEELWNTGIRAFEVVTCRHSSSDGDFGALPILCNNAEVKNDKGENLSVDDVIQNLKNKIANTSECAIVIFTYQPRGGLSYPARDAESYMTQVCNYFAKMPTDLIKYSPTLTLRNAQGKLIIIVRPTQRDEDSSDAMTKAMNVINNNSFVKDKIIMVNGCGTAKDKWRARGYRYNNEVSPDISSATQTWYGAIEWNANDIENAITSSRNWGNVTKGKADFSYQVNSDDYEIWYQEWARVNPGTGNDATRYGSLLSGGYYYWQPSYGEKLSNVTETFDMSMSGDYDGVDEKGTPNAEDKYVFINSLSGFYITDTYSESYQPLAPKTTNYGGGSKGDIEGLASDLNEDFYQYILSKQTETGATGIVMMDFVANKLKEDLSNKGSFYLPSVIINNNIKYNQTIQ